MILQTTPATINEIAKVGEVITTKGFMFVVLFILSGAVVYLYIKNRQDTKEYNKTLQTLIQGFSDKIGQMTLVLELIKERLK